MKHKGTLRGRVSTGEGQQKKVVRGGKYRITESRFSYVYSQLHSTCLCGGIVFHDVKTEEGLFGGRKGTSQPQESRKNEGAG